MIRISQTLQVVQAKDLLIKDLNNLIKDLREIYSDCIEAKKRVQEKFVTVDSVIHGKDKTHEKEENYNPFLELDMSVEADIFTSVHFLEGEEKMLALSGAWNTFQNNITNPRTVGIHYAAFKNMFADAFALSSQVVGKRINDLSQQATLSVAEGISVARGASKERRGREEEDTGDVSRYMEGEAT